MERSVIQILIEFICFVFLTLAKPFTWCKSKPTNGEGTTKKSSTMTKSKFPLKNPKKKVILKIYRKIERFVFEKIEEKE